MRRVKASAYSSALKQYVPIEGWFHTWAESYEEFQSGLGNYTFGIVEDDTGKIWEVQPKEITFLTPYQPPTDGSSKI